MALLREFRQLLQFIFCVLLIEVALTLLKVDEGWLAPSPLGDDLSVEVIDLAEGSLDAYVYI